jgi:hypothetical protein
VSPRGGLPRLLAAATACALCTCVAPSGAEVERRLVAGLTRDEALSRLAEGARIELRARVEAPASGDWGEQVEDRAVLGAILSASVRVDAPIAAFEQVRRERILSADDFFLFFDADGLLLYTQRRPAR